MKRLILIFFLTLSLNSLTKADDIRDFEIEGMSIGDSLLDYFSEDKIKSSKQQTQYPGSDRYTILTFNEKDRFEIYDSVQIDYKKNDKKYIIASIMGMLSFINDIDACYEEQKKIAEEVDLLFPKSKKNNGKQKKTFDKTGKSTSYLYEFHLLSNDVVQISCDDWSEEMNNKYNLNDHLGVSVMSKDLVDFLYNEAYN
tara:strand:+ start:786 stop:1379 length:594 start_codon:yes stop_codon:yes gene_type:complete